ncbi:MAG: hypothetical protein P8I27_02745 [Pirellulaceae bacterium]|nr:hypothetical protein [Pirellulaceae bacterium]
MPKLLFTGIYLADAVSPKTCPLSAVALLTDITAAQTTTIAAFPRISSRPKRSSNSNFDGVD